MDREHLRPDPPISTSLHDRIRELERLVKSQIKNSHAIKPVTSELLSETKSSPDLSLPANEPAKSNFVPAQNPQLSDNLGWMSLENAETSYVESAHWRAILDKVRRQCFIHSSNLKSDQIQIVELRDHFEDGSTPTGPLARETQVPEFEGPELLFGGYKTVEKRDILAAMPPRPLVDRLVVKCFNSVDIAPGTLTLLESRPFHAETNSDHSSADFLQRSTCLSEGQGFCLLTVASMRNFGRIHQKHPSCGLVFYLQRCAQQLCTSNSLQTNLQPFFTRNRHRTQNISFPDTARR